jgi:hypothetical protein
MSLPYMCSRYQHEHAGARWKERLRMRLAWIDKLDKPNRRVTRVDRPGG